MRLHDLLDFRAREQPDALFAVQGARRMTYREATTEANRLANGFVEAGLERGDRIAVLGKNSIDYAVLYFAASKAGVVPVPLSYRLAPPEWTYILNDARARVLIASADYVSAADTIRSEMKSVERFIAMEPTGAVG